MAIPLPFTFTNGTVIEAPQVNANFTALANAAAGTGPGGSWAVSQGGTGATSLPVIGGPGAAPFSQTLLMTNGSAVVPAGSAGGVMGIWGDPSDLGIAGINKTAYIDGLRFNGSSAAPTALLAGDNVF